MADPLFRNLIDWQQIGEEAEVIRIFGNENIGADLLPSLGVLCRERLLRASEEDLLSIKDDRKYPAGYEDVILIRKDSPPVGFLGCSEAAIQASVLSASSAGVAYAEHPKEAMELLSHPRDIRITAKEHNTIFDRRIQKMSDLPREVRDIFENASRIPDVLEIFLGRFSSAGGRGRAGFSLSLAYPKENMGLIFGKLQGPGKIGGMQEVEIRVTKGWENQTYLQLSAFSWAD
jgi:hypothetical protein